MTHHHPDSTTLSEPKVLTMNAQFSTKKPEVQKQRATSAAGITDHIRNQFDPLRLTDARSDVNSKTTASDIDELRSLTLGLDAPISPGANLSQGAVQSTPPTAQGRTLSPSTSNSRKGGPSQKKPQGLHRKSRSASLTTNFMLDVFRTPKQRQKENIASSAAHRRSTTLSPTSTSLVTAQSSKIPSVLSEDPLAALAIPSLAKPTSFLTGKEAAVTETNWSVEIPPQEDVLVLLKLASFMDSYRHEEAISLQGLVDHGKFELKGFAMGNKHTGIPLDDSHRKVVETFLECFQPHDNVQIRAFLKSQDDNPDLRREILVVERQNTFLCICRGTTAEQNGRFKSEEPTMLPEGAVVDNYSGFHELESALFSKLDKLVDESPFCDVCFSGHAMGAAMASVGSFRYATARPQLRVACIVSETPKVGDEKLRLLANGLVNLKAFRLEMGRPKEKTSFGHSIRLEKLPTAYRFGENEPNKFKLFHRPKDLPDYLAAVESCTSWVKDFYREDGAGVRGDDNEIRQMV